MIGSSGLVCGMFVFWKDEFSYLRYKTEKDILRPIPRTRYFLNAPNQTNLNALKAFLGMLNHYHRFLDRLSTTLEPIHKLHRKDNLGSGIASCKKHSKNLNSY